MNDCTIAYCLSGMWMIIALLNVFLYSQAIRTIRGARSGWSKSLGAANEAIKSAQVAQDGWQKSIAMANEAIEIAEATQKGWDEFIKASMGVIGKLQNDLHERQ